MAPEVLLVKLVNKEWLDPRALQETTELRAWWENQATAEMGQMAQMDKMDLKDRKVFNTINFSLNKWRSGNKSNTRKKDFPSSPTGVEPMTLQNTGWNALTTELWGTHGERGHILGSYV